MAGGDISAWARLIVNSLWGRRLWVQLTHTAWTNDKCPPWKKKKLPLLETAVKVSIFLWVRIKYCPHEYTDLSMTPCSPCHVISDPTTFETSWEPGGTQNTNPKVRRGAIAQHTNTKSEGGYIYIYIKQKGCQAKRWDTKISLWLKCLNQVLLF